MNNQESNFFTPILSAIAGIGAIVTVLSPLSLQNDIVAKLFILPDIISAVTVIAIIISIIIIWYASTNPKYLEVTSKWGKISVYQWTIFMILIFGLFYTLKVIVPILPSTIFKDLAGILQIILYLSGYYILSFILGRLLKNSYESFRYSKMEVERYDRIQETLSKAGFIDTKLKILGESYSKDKNGNTDYLGIDVRLRIADILHTITFSTDYSKVISTEIHCEEAKRKVEEEIEKPQ